MFCEVGWLTGGIAGTEIAKVDLSDTLGGTFGGICLIGALVFVVLWVFGAWGREGWEYD